MRKYSIKPMTRKEFLESMPPPEPGTAIPAHLAPPAPAPYRTK